MAYGTVKVDNVTFTYNSADATTTFSGFYASTTNNLTLSGTASAATFTGTTANFTNVNAQNISVTTALSGLAITGGTAGFTTVTGTTVTGTTANFVSGVFTTRVSGTTITGTTASFTSGVFTSLSGTTHTITSGVFASGTAALPSISFVSDPNTGVFSPGADQLAVATNGTGRLFIDATGNVNAPVSFRVGNGPTTGALSVQAVANGNLHIRDITAVTGFGAGVAFDVLNDAGSTVQDLAFRGATTSFRNSAGETLRITSTGALNFVGAGTAGSTQAVSFNGSAPVNSLVIDSSGRLGIGTSAPTSTLHIQHAAQTTGYWDGKGLLIHEDATANQGIAFYSRGSNEQYIASLVDDATSYLIIGARKSSSTNGVDALTIRGSGNVGIGTTSPKSILTTQGNIVGLSATTHSLQHYQLAASIYTVTSIDSVISGASGSLVFKTGTNWTNGDAVEAARIDPSGRLLVGTIASPAHQLQVSTDSAGKPSTNTWTIVSDERIKEEIELADLDLCYQAVKTIPLKRFKWKDEVYTEEQVKDRRKLGWIAQDVEAVFPKAVGTYEFKYNQVFEETIIPAVEEILDDEGNVTTPAQPERIEKGELISEDVIEDCRDLNSDQLYAAMYGAIQKLMIKVETLETELAALKAS